jgi:hypothetical protein
MIILPLLLAVSLQTAPAKAAAGKTPAARPAPAQTAPAKPIDPVKADSSNILYGPSKSLRSSTAAAVTGLPAAPVTVQFECLVGADSGAPERCFPLENGAKPAVTIPEFERRQMAWPQISAPATVAIALQRVRFTRVRPLAGTTKDSTPLLMLFSDTVSAGDVVTLGKSGGDIASSDFEMDDRPDGAILTAYYPAAALRANIGTRVKASCRVMPDRKLFCHDAQLIEQDSAITPDTAADFRNATYQVFDAIRLAPLSKGGDPVVGRDVDMRISFVVPN